MSRRPRSLLAAGVLLLLPIAAVVATTSGAGACTLMPTSLQQLAPADGGSDVATITVAGQAFFSVEGDLAANCSGATFSPLADVEVVATWSTPNGEVVDTMAGAVDPESYDLAAVTFEVPDGAFLVAFTATSGGETVTVEALTIQIDYVGPPLAPPTTAPTTDPTPAPDPGPGAVPPPLPAEPRPTTADYTG